MASASAMERLIRKPYEAGRAGYRLRGRGGLGPRWKDVRGRIYEWDSRHGTVEVYDRAGRAHRGEFDSDTGRQVGPTVPARRVEP